MRPNFSAGMPMSSEQDVSLEAADILDHQGRDVSVATVLA